MVWSLVSWPLTLLALIDGFVIGLGLIVAIGAQSLFVLRQGLANEHPLVACLICSFSDILLISLGISCFAFLGAIAWLPPLLTAGGAVFLLWYGFGRMRAAAAPALPAGGIAAGTPGSSWRVVALSCLALTWLNPHVYFDTVFLIGGLANRYAGIERLAFGVGACVASAAFFTLLAYGARRFAPMFGRPGMRRRLDVACGVLMWIMAANLGFQSVAGHLGGGAATIDGTPARSIAGLDRDHLQALAIVPPAL